MQGIAYRMLGSSAEAEDVVQDAWIRWREADRERLDSTEAWLVSVTTRLAIDRLRSAKVQREHYVGTWLPEPAPGVAGAGAGARRRRVGRVPDAAGAPTRS